MSKRLNLTGQKFGRLTVLEFTYVKNSDSYWLCKCECGNETIVVGKDLKNGHTKSCGCLRKEKCINIGGIIIHGMAKIRFYRIWIGMKTRCYNSNNPAYRNYGGRGITVCKRWLEFINFRDNMLASYLKHCEKFGFKQTTIERTNNNGNYELSNCKWATYKEQANNKRNNIKCL